MKIMIKENIALLLHPSLRGRAYIQSMVSSGLIPSEVLLMNGQLSESEVPDHIDHFDYYKPREEPRVTLKDNKINFRTVSSMDCNDPMVIEELKNLKSDWVIFSGGGILRKEVLSIGKKFIHVHPGKLPQYRGSTCFYYSLIKEGKCFCTAFIMGEKLDSGKIISCQEFKPPNGIDFDYVFDPWMRSVTVVKLLEELDFTKEINLYDNETLKSEMYYIIHPVLKHIAVLRK